MATVMLLTDRRIDKKYVTHVTLFRNCVMLSAMIRHTFSPLFYEAGKEEILGKLQINIDKTNEKLHKKIALL